MALRQASGVIFRAGMVFWFGSMLLAQTPHTDPQISPSITGRTDDNGCEFAPEYRRIQANKSDPRVAFLEITPIVYGKVGQANSGLRGDFSSLCDTLVKSSQDAQGVTAVFDATHAYLQVGNDVTNETVVYLPGVNGSPGVALYCLYRDKIEHRVFVFAFRNNKWTDLTQRYLGRFNLSELDYVQASQDAPIFHVLTLDLAKSRFHHNLWLTWNGRSFDSSQLEAAPNGWGCPDAFLKHLGQHSYELLCSEVSNKPLPCPKYDSSIKSDPRVAYLDIASRKDVKSGFSVRPPLCNRADPDHPYSESDDPNLNEAGPQVHFFDPVHGYVQMFYQGIPEMNDTIAYFSGKGIFPGVMLYSSSDGSRQYAYVFVFQNGKWENQTNKYLGPFHLGDEDYIVVPQYGRSARLIRRDEDDQATERLWLTWDGTRFVPSKAETPPAGWRCPDVNGQSLDEFDCK